jgi:hypothetical protein
MKKISVSQKVLFVLVAIALLSSCQKNEDFTTVTGPAALKNNVAGKSINTFYSSTQPVGNGIARAWVSQAKDGVPASVGITLSDKVLEKLPDDPATFLFALPDNKGTGFYKVAELNWNPHGHFPPNVYDIPHFDFHFYIIPNSERLSIVADDPKFAIAPAAQFVPPLYLQTPGGEPQMGAHWVDLLSPEFNGGVFTKTFIWGSYDGKFIFWEPMITLDYLLTKPDVTVMVRQPSAFQQDGYYPYQYRITYSSTPKEFNIILDLTYHEGDN